MTKTISIIVAAVMTLLTLTIAASAWIHSSNWTPFEGTLRISESENQQSSLVVYEWNTEGKRIYFKPLSYKNCVEPGEHAAVLISLDDGLVWKSRWKAPQDGREVLEPVDPPMTKWLEIFEKHDVIWMQVLDPVNVSEHICGEKVIRRFEILGAPDFNDAPVIPWNEGTPDLRYPGE